MTVARRFRDEIRSYVVPWLSDRHGATPERSAGFRFLWSMVAPLDAAMDVLVQGLRAAHPGQGTPTALPLIGRSRGMIRGQGESDAAYGARLTTWLDRWRIAGTAEAIATALHEYLGNHPKVRVITRSGIWVTAELDGSITRTTATWDWDSVSHPGRAGFWSDIWIVIYPTQWANAPGVIGDDAYGLGDGYGAGHQASRIEVDAVKSILAQWKSAHTKVRAVIWTSDATLFDPLTPASCPNGAWGGWGTTGSSRVASSRNTTTCRYWEL